MFTLMTIWPDSGKKNITQDSDEPEYTSQAALELKVAIAFDLISALALLILGSLVAANIITISSAAASPAMTAVGAFQLSPLLMGGFLALSKNRNLDLALRVLGLLP